MAFQPKLILIFLASFILVYLLSRVSFNCLDKTKELYKKKHIWISTLIAISFIILSLGMTSKYSKLQKGI